MDNVRGKILTRLRSVEPGQAPERIELPPPYEAAFSRDELIEKFAAKLAEQTGVFYRVEDAAGVQAVLTEIAGQEKIGSLMASEDERIKSLNLTEWGDAKGVSVAFPHDFQDRETFKNNVFNHADAGITSADFAVAESGTLAIVHDRDNARLLSLAPILHVAVVQIENIVPVYESVIEAVYEKKDAPSHVTFITGPSMTGDIQGQMFKGMHGPRRIIVIMVGK